MLSITDPNSTRRAYLLLVITTMCWGANAVLGRAAVGEVTPMMLTLMRWTGAVFIMLVVARQDIARDWPELRRNGLYLFLMGACGFTIFNGFMYAAAHSTTAVNIGIIQGAMPAIVLLGVFITYKTPIKPLQIAGVVVTLIGVSFVAARGNLQQLLQLVINRGDLFMLIASVFYAGYAVGLRKKPNVSGLSMFSVMALSALLVSLPLVGYEMQQAYFHWPTKTGWIYAAAITIFPSVVAQLCFIQGVSIIGPGRAGIFVNLVPIFASVFAITFLGERFEVFHAIALALVLGGIWLSEKATGR